MIKKKSSQRLRREQLDNMFSALRSRPLPPSPKKGWIREIREALGMSRAAFARRLSLDPSTVSRLEKSEANNTITLSSLKRLAQMLECDLSYVIVPRRSLSKILKERAERLIERENRTVEHTMRLEGQGSKKKGGFGHAFEVACLIEAADRRLWDEDDDK